MIIQFSIGNYSSFDKIQKLNFRATSLESCGPEVDQANLITIGNQQYLKLIGIYGANASGKSNLLRALAFFRELVAHSMSSEELSQSGVNPFRLSEHGFEQPSYFQIVLLLEQKKFRFGFTLTGDGRIESEWLFGPAEKNETFYFKRSGDDVQINKEWFSEAAELPLENLRDNALYLSFCSTFNSPIARSIRSYLFNQISTDLRYRRGTRKQGVYGPLVNYSTNRMVEQGFQLEVLKMLKAGGLVYNGIELPDKDPSSNKVILYKNIYDEQGQIYGIAGMDLMQDESDGTRKFYNYIGRLYRKFEEGGLYIIDEIDSNFHPSLLQKIIRLFQDPEINRGNAQLLFTSHDTNLMDPAIMRRDQFYFTEKTVHDATKVYSLADLKGIRNNADFARQYLAGLYGALPILNEYYVKNEEGNVDVN